MKEEVTKPYGDIYFEKNLPKNCGGCPFQYDGISCEALEYDYCPEELGRCLDSNYGTAAYDDAIFDRRYSKCPLQTTQSLKQQVREEVVEEIKKQLFNHFKVKNIEEYEKLSLIDALFTADTVIEILDTILKSMEGKKMEKAICNECGRLVEIEDGEEWGYCPFCENDQVELNKEPKEILNESNND